MGVNGKKREDAQIFVLCYKNVKYNIPNNSLYTPLQCGADIFKNRSLYPLKDNVGDNISERNMFYAEATGTYFLWKNVCKKYKYIGQTQYRRQLILNESVKLDEIFSSYDAILSKPIIFGEKDFYTVYGQYCKRHNKNDIDLVKTIIEDKFPSYLKDFDRHIINGNKLYAHSGIIMRSEDFSKYCDFLFTIIDEHRKINGINTVTDMKEYIKRNFPRNKQNIERQKFLYGFLAERLMTLFVLHNFKSILEIPYVKYEGV